MLQLRLGVEDETAIAAAFIIPLLLFVFCAPLPVLSKIGNLCLLPLDDGGEASALLNKFSSTNCLLFLYCCKTNACNEDVESP